jgi:hypothetical protein
VVVRRPASLLATMAAMLLAVACGGASSPFVPNRIPADDTFALLESRQHHWCETITGRTCGVRVSVAHPEYAAWVEWGMRPPAILWNERVLTDRQFWITDPRMAHEACHLKHGPQPEWSAEQKEDYANRCAIAYAGSAP